MGKKKKSSISHESRGKNVLLTTPQRNLPSSENSPWVAFLGLRHLSLLLGGWVPPSKVHPELPRALSASWHCQAAAPGRRHQDKVQNILISFKWPFLSHTVLSICSIFFPPWKRATPRGCPSLLLLTPKLLASSLNLLKESRSRQGHRKRRHNLLLVVLSQLIGSRN